MTDPAPHVVAQRINALETGIAVLRSEQAGICRRLTDEVEAREKTEDAIIIELRRVYLTLIGFALTIAGSAIGVMIVFSGGSP